MLNIVTTPKVLTDALFTQYGGVVGTSTSAQRTAAYTIAEAQAAEYIGTFLGPTRVTGTHSWPPLGQPLQLQHDRVAGIVSVTAILDAGCDCADDSIELSGCAWVKNADSGIVDVRQCGDTLRASCSACYARYGSPYQVRVVYDAGLPTGTYSDARLLMGLTMASQMALDQITNPAGGEGGAGEPGVKSFRSLSYSETRNDSSYQMTAFGNSARANYVANMLKHFRNYSVMKMGW